MKPAISFVFVNFRSAALLGRSLASVHAVASREGIPAEYIIVNNDQGERAFIDALASAHAATPQVVHQTTNEGFGRANNIGARIANGEVLFFVNPDTEIVKGGLWGLLAAFAYRPQALYGMALRRVTGEREPWSSGAFPSLLRIILSHLMPGLLPAPWRARQVQQTDWVSGAALAIRREFFQSLGGFDEAFFLYFEDVDLARRAAEASGWVGVYPFIELQHVGGQSHKSFREKKQAYYTGQRQYFRKWRPRYETMLLSLGQFLRRAF